MRLLCRSRIAAVAFLGLLSAATIPAQTITPLYSNASNSVGTVSQVAIANIGFGWVVTAVKNGSGDLEVIVWQDTGTGIVRRGSKIAGAITFGIGVTAVPGPVPYRATVVTAAFNSSFDLELISWHVSSSGAVTRAGSATSTQGGTTVAINQLGEQACGDPAAELCFGTVTNSSADLTVSVWDMVLATGVLSLRSTISAGAADNVGISQGVDGPVPGNDYFLTAANVSGNLEVTLWDANIGVVVSSLTGNATGRLAVSNAVLDANTLLVWPRPSSMALEILRS